MNGAKGFHSSSQSLETQGYHPSVSEIDPMASSGSILPPYDLGNANVGDRDFPGMPFASEKGAQNAGLWGSKTHHG